MPPLSPAGCPGTGCAAREVYHTDERWKHLLSKCATIESLLKELGAFRHWKPSAWATGAGVSQDRAVEGYQATRWIWGRDPGIAGG